MLCEKHVCKKFFFKSYQPNCVYTVMYLIFHLGISFERGVALSMLIDNLIFVKCETGNKCKETTWVLDAGFVLFALC